LVDNILDFQKSIKLFSERLDDVEKIRTEEDFNYYESMETENPE